MLRIVVSLRGYVRERHSAHTSTMKNSPAKAFKVKMFCLLFLDVYVTDPATDPYCDVRKRNYEFKFRKLIIIQI